MAGQVKVEDFEVFRVFRAALLKFAQAVETSLSDADTQVARMGSWLEGEQATYWQGQLRKRAEAATKARDAVRQKKIYKDSTGHTPSAVEEEKALAKCLAALAEAEQKSEAVRKWRPRLEKEADVYRGGTARLRGTASVLVPQAVALLDRLAARLEEYVQIETPAGAGEAITRGGEAAPEAAGGVTATGGAEAKESAGAASKQTEGGDGAGRQ